MKLEFFKRRRSLVAIFGFIMMLSMGCSRPKPPSASAPLTAEPVSPPVLPSVQLGDPSRRIEDK
jgi:hypothetical protein